ncbi:MAG TPA: cytochrome d ubiquinol oxidase subunit II [Nitrolancea sp.]|nr:cytochrome d ubiquinol oxidase subunit II [Nitrolancea sp.]
MPTLWFILVGFMLAMYALLDGFDLGAGAIHPFAAKNNDERRSILQAIGPVWDGNEVWLIAAGGTLFFSFPLLYSSSFSGFYLPLMIVLWLLMMRGLSIELRTHVDNPIWASFWDGLFFLGSALLAIFLGAAIANVVRGVPLDQHGYFFEPLWTDFNPRSSTPGILDWYTILIGVLALSTLVLHGANYIRVKTEGDVNARARSIARQAWVVTLALTLVATPATLWLRHSMFTRFNDHPWGYVLPLVAVVGLLGSGYFTLQRSDGWSLVSSGAFIVAMLGSTAFGLYPNVLPAVDPANSLTVHNAAAPHYGLIVGLVWWSIGMVLATIYFVLIYRMFRGKVKPAGDGY